jgi:hypothetical protein
LDAITTLLNALLTQPDAKAGDVKDIPNHQRNLEMVLAELTDEKIAEIWHQSGGHLYKFAKMLRDWLQNAS